MSTITNTYIRDAIRKGQMNFVDVDFSYGNKTSIDTDGSPILDFSEYFKDLTTIPKLNLSFHKCKFNIRVVFKDINLKISNEYENAFIDSCIFNEKVEILNVECFSHLIIKDTDFNKQLIADKFSIDEGLSFENINFKSENDFSFFNIKRHSTISKCSFGNRTTFTNCNFYEVDFDNITFENDVTFDIYRPWGPSKYYHFKMNYCQFNGRTIFKQIIFYNFDFRFNYFKDNFLDFIQCEFLRLALFRYLTLNSNSKFIGCDLTSCSFLNSYFEDAYFINCYFDFANMVDESIFFNKSRTLRDIVNSYGIHNSLELSPSVGEMLNNYKSFEINFDKHKDFDMAGEFHKKYYSIRIVGDKETIKRNISDCFESLKHPKILKRYYKRKSSEFLYLIIRPLFRLIITKIYGFISSFGESYIRPFFLYISIFALFSVVYLFSGISYHDINNKRDIIISYSYGNDTTMYSFIHDYGISVLYSLKSSIPLNKSLEVVESSNNLTAKLSYFQTITQTVILAFFLIALKRKFKR